MILWIMAGIVSVILLLKYWGSKNAVWGGLTVGILVGLIIIASFRDLNFVLLWKAAVIGILLGYVAELLGKVSDKIRTTNG